MRRWRWSILAGAVALTFACAPDVDPTEPPADEAQTDIVPGPDPDGNGDGPFRPNYSGLVRVKFLYSPTRPSDYASIESTVRSAFGAWEANLMNRINFTFDPNAIADGEIRVTVYTNESLNGGYWCGMAAIALYRKPGASSSCGGRVTDDLYALALHEVGQRLGMQTMTTPATSACISNVPTVEEGELNQSLCAHEREAIRYAYQQRSSAPDLSRLMITGVRQTATSLSVPAGSTRQANAYFTCEPSLTVFDCPSAPVSWTSSNTTIFTTSGTGTNATITGRAQGIATLTARVAQASHTVSSPGQHSIPVTVTAPPPPPMHAWIEGPDVVSVKTRTTWTAGASGGSSSNYSFNWYLRPVGTTTWSFMTSGPTLSFIPSGGSDFELRVQASAGGQSANGYMTVANCIGKTNCGIITPF